MDITAQKILWICGFIVLFCAAAFGVHAPGHDGQLFDTNKNATTMTTNDSNVKKIKTLLVGGGCFWCMEADLEKLPGVTEVTSGYAGGTTTDPTYDNYAKGGHREVVEVAYDPSAISFAEIITYALKHMDPTDADGSFHDRGESYAPALYYENQEEEQLAKDVLKMIEESGRYNAPLSVKVEAKPTFYPAEEYHQDYYKKDESKDHYERYRQASGRDAFIESVWADETEDAVSLATNANREPWDSYQKPNESVLEEILPAEVFAVTQEESTERPGSSPLDKNYEPGIYVDVLSGEPLFSSKDKYDSGSGWPSFVRPISDDALTEHVDTKLGVPRTEIRSHVADNHLGHVFPDGPADRGGQRYCMNGLAMRFIPLADMEKEGYGDYIRFVE